MADPLGLLAIIAGLGLVIGLIEGWSVQESIYFAFVSGLTIGYGDFAPLSLRATRSCNRHRHLWRAPDCPAGSGRRQGLERPECRRGRERMTPNQALPLRREAGPLGR